MADEHLTRIEEHLSAAEAGLESLVEPLTAPGHADFIASIGLDEVQDDGGVLLAQAQAVAEAAASTHGEGFADALQVVSGALAGMREVADQVLLAGTGLQERVWQSAQAFAEGALAAGDHGRLHGREAADAVAATIADAGAVVAGEIEAFAERAGEELSRLFAEVGDAAMDAALRAATQQIVDAMSAAAISQAVSAALAPWLPQMIAARALLDVIEDALEVARMGT